MFKSALIHVVHLSANGLLGMLFKRFQDSLVPKDSTNGFSQLFFVYFYVIARNIPKSITKALGVAKLLALAKPSSGIQPIIINKVLCWLVNMTLCFQFCNAFLAHLSPH
jgi:hypothetical protein